MDKNSTQNSLISFLYHETTATENLNFRQILEIDTELSDEFQQLSTAYRNLPKAQFNPSTAALQSILKYSQQTAVVRSF